MEWYVRFYDSSCSCNSSSALLGKKEESPFYIFYVIPMVNADGVINGSDLALILVGWGQPSSPYDLDGNGIVNGADLAIILVGWGLCP